MGRPTFLIDGQRLKALREGAGMTQLSIATKTQEKLGKANRSTVRTVESDYQRIERTGRTSRSRAQAFAEILGVSVEVLQGKAVPEPIDYVAGITQQIRERYSLPGNDLLVRAVKEIPEPLDVAVRQLAEEISERIESVQLARNPVDLAELMELTGIPESELLKPANVLGYWLIVTNGSCERRTQLVRGVSSLKWHLNDIAEGLLNGQHSDGAIRMSRDGLWFRIEIRPHAHPHTNFRFDFVRCSPVADKGIQWGKANLTELSEIQSSFKQWAFSALNFVTDFSGRDSPSDDLRRLRFVVTNHEGSWRPNGRMVVCGDLARLSGDVLDKQRQRGNLHSFVQEQLVRDLKKSLAPLLAMYPHECWSLRKGERQVSLELDEAATRKRPIHDRHLGLKYRITLVEELCDGKFAPVPWRARDVEQLEKEIMNMVGDPNMHSLATKSKRRVFEPYTEDD